MTHYSSSSSKWNPRWPPTLGLPTCIQKYSFNPYGRGKSTGTTPRPGSMSPPLRSIQKSSSPHPNQMMELPSAISVQSIIPTREGRVRIKRKSLTKLKSMRNSLQSYRQCAMTSQILGTALQEVAKARMQLLSTLNQIHQVEQDLHQLMNNMPWTDKSLWENSNPANPTTSRGMPLWSSSSSDKSKPMSTMTSHSRRGSRSDSHYSTALDQESDHGQTDRLV